MSNPSSEWIRLNQPDQTEHDRIAAAGYYHTTYSSRLFTIKEDHRNDQDGCLTCSHIATPAFLETRSRVAQQELASFGVEWDPSLRL